MKNIFAFAAAIGTLLAGWTATDVCASEWHESGFSEAAKVAMAIAITENSIKAIKAEDESIKRDICRGVVVLSHLYAIVGACEDDPKYAEITKNLACYTSTSEGMKEIIARCDFEIEEMGKMVKEETQNTESLRESANYLIQLVSIREFSELVSRVKKAFDQSMDDLDKLYMVFGAAKKLIESANEAVEKKRQLGKRTSSKKL
ncbi:MAG: hypothetical protein LBG13_00995 [Holosporales bacterium]|nr:hypothetical protein [Holosporales bacterium]